MKFILTIYLLLIFTLGALSKGLDPMVSKHKTPPRIIRACCAFGYDIGYVAVPLLKHTDVLDLQELGKHGYLGGRKEGNGIVYSYRGGFVDVGHMRDQADWTAYLYEEIRSATSDTLTIHLGYEGGPKVLTIFNFNTFTDDDKISLAGRIAYDLSVWHEIATWFGASLVPFLYERYSSFSIEDCYSNLLGATLGMRALRSEKPYDEAMTFEIQSMLDTLEAVSQVELTFQAMDMVYNTWWTRTYRFPSINVTQKRDVDPYHFNLPALVPGWESEKGAYALCVPQNASNGDRYMDHYLLRFKLNHKFPVHELFPDRNSRLITHYDFQHMIDFVASDIPNRLKPPRVRRNK